jgi:hypothetical protein
MSLRQSQELLFARDEIVDPPPKRACEDQSFELPAGLYIAMATMFAGFVAVLSFAFNSGHMAVAYGVIFAFIAAYFAVPALFPPMAPRKASKALRFFEFGHRGIATATGRATALEATILVLLLPFLILCFGIAIAAISVVL